MPSGVRPKFFLTGSVKIRQIVKKYYEKNYEKNKQGPEMVNFGASKLGVRGPRAPRA